MVWMYMYCICIFRYIHCWPLLYTCSYVHDILTYMYENGPKKKMIFSLWFHQHEFRFQPYVFWEFYNFVRVVRRIFTHPQKWDPFLLILFPYHSHKEPLQIWDWYGSHLWEAAGGSPALRTAVAKHLERSRRVGAAWRVEGECGVFSCRAMSKKGPWLVSIRIPGRLQWRKPGWLGFIGDELFPSLCHEMRIPFWTQQFDVDSFTEIISFQEKKTGGESWLTFLSLGFLPDWYFQSCWYGCLQMKEFEWI